MHILRAGLALTLLSPLALHAIDVTSPNGRVKLAVTTDADARLTYAVSFDGTPRLHPARAGIVVDARDLGENVELGPAATRRLTETFPWRGNKRRGTNDCVVVEIPVQPRDGGPSWTFEVRVFNDGAAFRHRVPGTGTRRVSGEPTAWQIPADTTLWLQTDTDDYEGVYHRRLAGEVPLTEKVGDQERPTHIGPPLTIAYPDGRLALISEAALIRYSGLTLRPAGGGRFQAAFEDDPQGWTHDGPVTSPWRVILLARDLNALVNSDVIPALNEPPDPALFPDGPDAPWLKPGKAPCTWMVHGNDGAQWDRQKWFVDVAAATGCEYLLVDAGWRSERWGWLKNGGDVWARAAELCRYGAERNVGIVLWHAFPEGRDDGPGLTAPAARDELFRRCAEAGVKGVKIDFFNSESRATLDAYEDLARRAAQHRLMINFHGANKPTGESRTWPNEITREGIREQEYILWDVLPLAHYGALPFSRMVVGHADFLPGYHQAQFLKNTTRAFQMAAVVVFNSPFLCWPDNPEAYLDSPVLPFVRSVPVVWDETRVLPGSVIGDTVILARRSGAAWYVAVLNCREEARTLELDLSPFLAPGQELTVLRDGAAKTAVQVETGTGIPASGRVEIRVLPGGGWVGILRPPKTYSGWKE